MEAESVPAHRWSLGEIVFGKTYRRLESLNGENHHCKPGIHKTASLERVLCRAFSSTVGRVEIQIQNAGIKYGYLEAPPIKPSEADGCWLRRQRNPGLNWLQPKVLPGEGAFCPKNSSPSCVSRASGAGCMLVPLLAFCLASGGTFLWLLFDGHSSLRTAAAGLVVAVVVPLSPLLLLEASCRRVVKRFSVALESLSALHKITCEALRWIRELEAAEETQRGASQVHRAFAALSAVRVPSGVSPSDETPTDSPASVSATELLPTRSLPTALPLRLALKSVLESELRALTALSEEVLEAGHRQPGSVLGRLLRAALLRLERRVLSVFANKHRRCVQVAEEAGGECRSAEGETGAPAGGLSEQSSKASSLKRLRELANQVRAAQLLLCMRVSLLVKSLRLQTEATFPPRPEASLKKRPLRPEETQASSTAPRRSHLRRALLSRTEGELTEGVRSLETELREAISPASSPPRNPPTFKRPAAAHPEEAVAGGQTAGAACEWNGRRLVEQRGMQGRGAVVAGLAERLRGGVRFLRDLPLRVLRAVRTAATGSAAALRGAWRLEWLSARLGVTAERASSGVLTLRLGLEEEFLCAPSHRSHLPRRLAASSTESLAVDAEEGGNSAASNPQRSHRLSSHHLALASVSRRLGAALALLRLPLLSEGAADADASRQKHATTGEADLECVLMLAVAHLRDALAEGERLLRDVAQSQRRRSPAPREEASSVSPTAQPPTGEHQHATPEGSRGEEAEARASGEAVCGVLEVFTALGGQSSGGAALRHREEACLLNLMEGTDEGTRAKSQLAMRELKLRLREKEAQRTREDAPPCLVREIRLSVAEAVGDGGQQTEECVSLHVRHAFLPRAATLASVCCQPPEDDPDSPLDAAALRQALPEAAELRASRPSGGAEERVRPSSSANTRRRLSSAASDGESREYERGVAEQSRARLAAAATAPAGGFSRERQRRRGAAPRDEGIRDTPLRSQVLQELFAAQIRRRRGEGQESAARVREEETSVRENPGAEFLGAEDEEGWEKCDVFEAVGESDDVPVWVGVGEQDATPRPRREDCSRRRRRN